MKRILIFAAFAASLWAQNRAPAGLRIPVMLRNTIHAGSAIGQRVTMATTKAVKVPDTHIEIPMGATVNGRISEAQPIKGKEPSVLSIVADSVEWKGGALKLHAFIVGQMDVRNSNSKEGWVASGNGEPPGSGITAVPCCSVSQRDQIPPDHCTKLRQAENADIGSELVCKDHNVQLDAGSTFTLANAPESE